MRDAGPAEALLSLFTARERAESIAGDLIEERDVRGSAWFWLNVVRTTFALFASTLANAPATVCALGVLGFALLVALTFPGVAAVFLFPLMGPMRSVLLALFCGNAALWTGISLVKVAPKHGMPACLTLAVAGEALLLAWTQAPTDGSVIAYTSALFAVAPLLTGAAIARRRMASLEQHHG